MTRRILGVVVGLGLALGMTAGTATARGATPTTINFTVQNVAFGDCISFDMVSPGGPLLGTGVSCVQSVQPPEGCSSAGCTDTVHAIFTLDLGRGTLTLPVTLNERWLTDTTVRQIDSGRVVSGTGDFAGVDGSLFCAGTLTFTATGLAPRLICTLHVS